MNNHNVYVINNGRCANLDTGVFWLKRYLTSFFIILSVLILLIGLKIDVRWNGIASWGLAFICLIFATYFTKYIPNEKSDKKKDS